MSTGVCEMCDMNQRRGNKGTIYELFTGADVRKGIVDCFKSTTFLMVQYDLSSPG